MNELLLPAPDIGRYLNRVTCAEATDFLRGLPTGSVQTLITSPPYYKARDYGVEDQLGQEDTPAQYVARLVAILREARRVLRDDGTVWLNIADSYSAGGMGTHDHHATFLGAGTAKAQALGHKRVIGFAEKNQLFIPHRVAIALQDDGWICRDTIIWHKPNPMPASVTDRTTTAHEYIFLLSKVPRYYYDADAIKTPVKPESIKRKGRAVSSNHKNHDGAPGQTPHSMFRERPNTNKQSGTGKRTYSGFNERYDGEATPMANARSVWTIPTKGFKGAHFATWPEALARRMILVGAPVGGIVLDPFAGSGTTLLVARNLGRVGIGCDLNPEYAALANDRLSKPFTLPMLEMFA